MDANDIKVKVAQFENCAKICADLLELKEDEAKEFVARQSIKKLEELKLQIIARNPQITGVAIKEPVFKVGDVVRVPQNPQSMTVTFLGYRTVNCKWFDLQNNLHHGNFLMDSLELIASLDSDGKVLKMNPKYDEEFKTKCQLRLMEDAMAVYKLERKPEVCVTGNHKVLTVDTKNGHKVEFKDIDQFADIEYFKNKRIKVISQSNNILEMIDEPKMNEQLDKNKGIKLTSQSGHIIEMIDEEPAKKFKGIFQEAEKVKGRMYTSNPLNAVIREKYESQYVNHGFRFKKIDIPENRKVYEEQTMDERWQAPTQDEDICMPIRPKKKDDETFRKKRPVIRQDQKIAFKNDTSLNLSTKMINPNQS